MWKEFQNLDFKLFENLQDFSYFSYDRNIREVECEMYLLLTFIFKVDSKFEIRKWRKSRD